MTIDYREFVHPQDESALAAMKAIPGFTTAVKAFMKYFNETLVHGLFMASKIRLSPTQLPHIYKRLPPICKMLGITEPEFYLEMNPMPNAYTMGDTKVFLVVTSGLLEYLDDDEIDSVIAHECGHIACHHVLYHTMANYLILAGESLGLIKFFSKPIELALLYWQRKSELSADRAAATLFGVESVIETQVRLAGGSKQITQNINIDEWIKQSEDYEEIRDGSKWEKLLQLMVTMNNTHPFAAVRVREIVNWSRTSNYSNLRNKIKPLIEQTNTCPNCHKPIEITWKFCRHCGIEL